jgi:RimJ/RimL family protein N-acetyltransferase
VIKISQSAPTNITIPTILTERLILRCWQSGDLAPYATMNEDAETMIHLHGTMDYAATERLVTHLIGMWHLRGFGMWAVELRDDGSFVGRAGLYQTSQWPDPEVAWSIRRDLWNQGLATEAGAAALAYGFGIIGLDRITSLPSAKNYASVRVAEKLGMRFERIATIGPWEDSSIYAIMRNQWETGS